MGICYACVPVAPVCSIPVYVEINGNRIMYSRGSRDSERFVELSIYYIVYSVHIYNTPFTYSRDLHEKNHAGRTACFLKSGS